MLHFGLKKDGYLFLGPSESATVIKDDFTEINNKWNILKSNKTGRAIRFDAFSSQRIGELRTTTMELPAKQAGPVSKTDLAGQIDSALLRECAFNGVCTDEHLSVIQSFGNTKPYLKNINFKHDLNELLRAHISTVFKAAAHKAFELNERVTLDRFNLDDPGKVSSQPFNIVLSPFALSGSDERLLLVLFTETKTGVNEKNIIYAEDISEMTREHVISLEREVAQLKHTLTVAHERISASNEYMQSFNEELQSANEEMQSANEEMQSSNEELQSVNEELQTVNNEHQLTISQLTDLNDDLNNYFRSNINGQLFVDRELLLKRYSPGAVKHINIREGDIGRPLSNITNNIRFETLIADIRKVIDDEEPITREAEATDGRVYQVMTMPYLKKNSQKADGAIISFYDITELKKILGELDISNKSLLRINADLNNFVFGASHDLNAPILNIEMLLEILNEKLDTKDPEVIELSGMMHQAVTNFKGVISDLARVGSIESEDTADTLESFPVLFEEIKAALSEKIKVSKAVFLTDFVITEVRFARKNLRSVMLNLITNALKFSFPKRLPKISIKTEKSDQFIILTIRDNGIGIAKDHIDQIFKKYKRVNEDAEGSGIGLYLIRKIINASGGKIEVESKPGKGCVFKVFFKV